MTRRMLLGLVAAVGLAFGLADPALAGRLEEITRATVAIDCRVPGGQGGFVGTGMVIHELGYILTSTTTVPPGAVDIHCRFIGPRTLPARLVVADETLELAVVKVDPPKDGPPLSALAIGDSRAIKVGQTVFTVGDAYTAFRRSGRLTVSLGILSGTYELKRQINCRILPAPERIYVPAKTGAAAAGVLLGCQLADIDSTVVIVVPPGKRAPRPERIARRAFSALARRSRRVASTSLRPGALEVRAERAPRPGAPGTASHAPEALLRDLEALDLEVQFAARAMAALIEDQRRGVARGPVLFWHTRPARRIDPRPSLPPAGLPQEFREFFVTP